MNKRTMKKGLAIVLALVMVFAMTATAFAANSGIDVTIKMDGGVAYPTMTVTSAQIADRIAHIPNRTNHLYDDSAASATVPNVGYTVADALIEAWLQVNGSGQLLTDEIATGWDNIAEHPGMFFSTYAGMSSNDGKYYLVDSYQQNGKTMYKYYWRGYTWTMYINGATAPALYYATEYGISNTSSVDFDYALTKSDNFTVDYYIQGCLNASEDPYN